MKVLKNNNKNGKTRSGSRKKKKQPQEEKKDPHSNCQLNASPIDVIIKCHKKQRGGQKAIKENG